MKTKKKEARKTMIVWIPIFILLFFEACSSYEPILNEEDKVEVDDTYTRLNRKLNLYNQSYLMFNTCPQTRSFWSKWNWFNTRGKYIASADALGARIGARWGIWGFLGGAVGASLVAVLVNHDEVETTGDKLTCGSQSATLLPSSNPDEGEMTNLESSVLDSIGYYHNEIILSIGNKNPAIYNQNLNTDEVMAIVSGEMEGLDFPTPEESTIKGIFNEIGALVPNKDVLLSEEAFVSHLKSVQPEYLQDYKIISDYLTTSQMIARENMQDYTEGVVKIIQESELRQEEKQALAGSILVGGNSALLWAEADLEMPSEN